MDGLLQPVPYSVEHITEDQAEGIRLQASRYAWADTLQGCIVEDEAGEFGLQLSEVDAWQFHQGADEDDLQFPGADHELTGKLLVLWASIS